MKPGKQKILIVGIGGVGGYFGGLLAKAYEHDHTIDIYFLARGTHLKNIRQKGLKVIQKENTFIANPKLATDDPSKIGQVNAIILCTKTYDLETVLISLKPCIDSKTVLLPLLNGVDSSRRIKSIFPQNEVLNGCVYIISKIKNPGVVENFGNIQTLYFGPDQMQVNTPINLEEIFKNAGVNSTFSEKIQTVIWEKFIFISATATATSYYNCTLGELLENDDKRADLNALIKEATAVARLKHIEISATIEQDTLIKLKSLPFETTSSMQRDFSQQRKTEVSALTAIVVTESRLLGAPAPTYEKMLKHLIHHRAEV